MNDIIERKMVDGVYTITNIRSSEQLADFFKEVVENNFEKYVGITTQGVKYGYNEETHKGFKLSPEVSYVLNPHYKPAEIVDEVEPVTVEVEQVAEPEPEVNVNVIDEVEVAPAETEVVEEPVAAVHTETDYEETINNLRVELEQLQNLVAIKEEQCAQKDQELSELRAYKTELAGKLEQANNKIVELNTSLIAVQTELDKAHTSEPTTPKTLDELIDDIKALGYIVYITK